MTLFNGAGLSASDLGWLCQAGRPVFKQMTKEETILAGEIVRGYYNRILSDPNITIEKIVSWLEDDLGVVQQEEAVNATSDIINNIT